MLKAFNVDLQKRVVIDTSSLSWQPSPRTGVWRKRLSLQGSEEAGCVTSIVRYEPGSRFHSHPHPQGEEILVLAGVFSDETGDYPEGSYLLNPEGFSHSPFSHQGCTIFVKLRQYAGKERRHVSLKTKQLPWLPSRTLGVEVKPLYTQAGFGDKVRLERWHPWPRKVSHTHDEVEEVFVIAGEWQDEHGSYGSGTWLRNPPGSRHIPTTQQGCVLYVKTYPPQ